MGCVLVLPLKERSTNYIAADTFLANREIAALNISQGVPTSMVLLALLHVLVLPCRCCIHFPQSKQSLVVY